MTFVSGVSVADGILATIYLGTDTVPAGASYVNGFACSPGGALYICDWPANGDVFYEGGIARRRDGAVCSVEALPDVIHMGLGLTSRGEVCLTTSGEPAYFRDGVGVESDGRVFVSEGVAL